MKANRSTFVDKKRQITD